VGVRARLEAFEEGLFGPDAHTKPLRRVARILILALRGFVRDAGFHHASALAFDTVLALVPLLVIIIGTLRGLGAYDQFVETTIEPWIAQTFGPSPDGVVTLRDAFLQVIDLGEHADLEALGFVGFVVLLYLVLILLTTVETTLNRMYVLRKVLSPLNPVDSMEFLLEKVKATDSNDEFLASMNS